MLVEAASDARGLLFVSDDRPIILFMELGDFPLLNTPHLVVVMLKTTSGGEASIDDALNYLRKILRVAGEQPPFAEEILRQRLQAIGHHLMQVGLLAPVEGGRFRITGKGRRAIADHPAGFDTADLMDDPQFRRRLRLVYRQTGMDDPRETQYQAGYAAFRQGMAISDNPHHQDTIDHLAWEDGWCEARDDALD